MVARSEQIVNAQPDKRLIMMQILPLLVLRILEPDIRKPCKWAGAWQIAV